MIIFMDGMAVKIIMAYMFANCEFVANIRLID